MTQNQPSRRTVAGRSALLALASLCLILTLFSTPALAQHGGGRPMGGNGGMMGERTPNFAPNGANPHNLERPNAEFRSQQPRMGLQLGLGGRWWDDHGTARRLSLNSEQQRRMDTIFETNKPTLLNLYTNLQREEVNLAGLSHADLQDETKVFAAIDRVSQARSELEKENAHILLQIRQQLDPQQLQALDRQIATSH